MTTGKCIVLVSAFIISGAFLLGSMVTPAEKAPAPGATAPAEPKLPTASSRRTDAMKQLVFTSRTHKGGFGSVLLLDGTLTNQSRLDIRDPRITCQMVAPSGTSFGTATATLYERITPGETVKVNDLNFGFVHSQAYGVACEVTDLIATDAQPPAPSTTPTPAKATPVKSSKVKQAKLIAKGATE